MMLCISLASCTTTETKEPKQSAVPISRTKTEPNLKDASELNTQLAIGYIQRQQYKPAKDKLLKSIEQNPDNLVAYKTLAYLYALLGLPEEAEEKYQEALGIKPDDSDLLNSYGAFLCSIGKLDEAHEKLKQ